VPTLTEQPLYVILEEIPALMGVGINSGRKALQEMRKHPKFPPRSIGGKYYWPLVKDFLDIWNGRRVDVRGVPAEQAHVEISNMGRRRPGLEATKRRLAERMASKADVSDPANGQTPNRGRAWANLEAAEERLGRGRIGLISEIPVRR